jgi:transposase
VPEVIPVSRSKPYSSVSVKCVEIEAIARQWAGQRCWLGVDVGKAEFRGVLCWPDGSFHRPWKIKNPGEIAEAVSKLVELSKSCSVTVAMESSGTYGDAFRQALADAKIPVRRVSGKAVKDQSELFDGVPSQHDSKDGAIIGDLASRGKSRAWELESGGEVDQAMRYWVRQLERSRRIRQVHAGRIEALLARHWPEAAEHLEAGGATLINALARWGSPAALAQDSEAAEELAGFGGHYLTEQKIAAVMESARRSVGVRMNAWEMRELKDLAGDVLAEREKSARCRKELEKLAAGHAVIQAQAPAVGLVTACVLWVCQGDPRGYGSAAAYRKAMGLNLTERSSGMFQGQLRLSKRGPRLSRRWLYFAAMRQMKSGPAKLWAQRKKERDGGDAMRAVVAVMRRLTMAAWHVAVHGTAFDAQLLFRTPATARRGQGARRK